MDLSKLAYLKREPVLDLKEPIQQGSMQKSSEDIVPFEIAVSSAYQKLEGELSSSLVFVLSGGEKRERDFLRELIRGGALHSLRVAFISKDGQGLQPYQMQKKWEEIQTAGMFTIKSQVFHLDEFDKVFLVTDVDQFYDQLVQIFNKCLDVNQGQWIVSNPCFEIWLYYCFLNNPEQDLSALESEDVAQRSKKLKALGNDLVPGGFNPCRAFERMAVGIEHGRAHYNVDMNGIPILCATQMCEMAAFLVNTMNKRANEYAEYVKKKEDFRNMMRERI
jgi:hypothetical protein